MYDLVGAIGVEAVKGGLAVAAGVLIAKGTFGLLTFFGVVTATATAPIIVIAVLVLAAGIGLNRLDNTYQIKDAVIAGLKTLPDTLNELGKRPLYHFHRGIQYWVDQQR